MITKAIKEDSLNAILRLLTPPNRLACMIALCTGLRIDDVLHLKTEKLRQEKMTVVEFKTGKHKTVRLPQQLRQAALRQAGHVFVFENRLNGKRCRTRQAVWKDMKRVASLLHLKGVAPHSLRKTYARGLRDAGFSETQIQRALNHSSPLITRLYTMADEVGINDKSPR